MPGSSGQKWWEGADIAAAAMEPEDGPEWIEMKDGAMKKPEYLEWKPAEWSFYCGLCNYSKGVRVDKAHLE